MIARRLRMNTPSKSSITRLIAYLTNSQGSSNRVQDVRITGCESEDATWASMEMLAVQQQNTRAKSDKTYHCMISFQEGEHPSPAEIVEIEQRFCESLGYGSHQRVSVLHGDTEHLHLHIAINKIHPEKLTIHEPFYDHKELARVCTEVERQYGLGVDNHTFRTQARPNAAINMERAGDIESLTGWIQRTCLADLKDARDWKTFGAVLAKHGLTLKARETASSLPLASCTSRPVPLIEAFPKPLWKNGSEGLKISPRPLLWSHKRPMSANPYRQALLACGVNTSAKNRSARTSANACGRNVWNSGKRP